MKFLSDNKRFSNFLIPPPAAVGVLLQKFRFVIIDYSFGICYTVTIHTPGGVYDRID